MRNNVNHGLRYGRRSGAWKLGLAGLTVGVVLLAQALKADDAGPPARAVRLSNVDGTVHVSQGGQMLADNAIANVPLFEGTQVVTGEDGRAEIQFEDGSMARISPNSSLTIKTLRGQGTSGEAVISMDAGLGYFELEGSAQSGTMRVEYGATTITPSGATVLRVNLDTPPGQLAVFSGNAHLERGAAASIDVHGGQSVTLSGSDPNQFILAETIEPDSWDSWNTDRDQALGADATTRTATTNGMAESSNPAWNDLDANGSWYNVPGQGNVWSPYDAADPNWDPYGNGSWMYTPSYGYIWASGYSWGYMPYQCGLWNWYDGFGWGWAPGINPCRGWWWGGFYGGPYVGLRFGGYRPPNRPRRPFGTLANRHTALPLIAVTRRAPSGAVSLPSRDRTAVVEIAGHTLQPQHPISPRPQYLRATGGPIGRSGIQGGYATHGGVPGYTGTKPGTPAPARNTGGGHPASGGGAAPRAPSGSGGGGGAHPSSGGGAHH